MSRPLELTGFEPAMADELVAMWRASFDRALAPYRDAHTLAEQRTFLTDILAPRAELTVAHRAGTIVGFLARAGVEVEQLYVHVDFQHRGVGSMLIHTAKGASPEGLHLYTFQRNLNARRFYRKHGFREIAYGHSNMEGLPDVELTWQP